MHTDELELTVVTELRRIMRAIDLNSLDLLHKHGVTTPQLITLRELGRMTELRVGELAAMTKVSQATMTGILDRLVQRGIVVRNRKEEDRRSVYVSITEQGRTFLENAPSLLQDHFRTELARLPDGDQARILSVLKQIAKMMGADELTAAPILTTGHEALAGPDPKLRPRHVPTRCESPSAAFVAVD